MGNCAGFTGHLSLKIALLLVALRVSINLLKLVVMLWLAVWQRWFQDIPPYVIADGQPARVISLNSVGLSRAGISEEVHEI